MKMMKLLGATVLLCMSTMTMAGEITVKNITAEEAIAKSAELRAMIEAHAQGTPDGLTPATEDICTKWGLQRQSKRSL